MRCTGTDRASQHSDGAAARGQSDISTSGRGLRQAHDVDIAGDLSRGQSSRARSYHVHT